MNRGAQALREVLAQKGRGSAHQLAKRLGVDDAAVSKWLKGDIRPATKHRAIIEDEHAVGWRLWDEELPRKRRKAS
jgi:DNA-binding transcriptional regulator YdaS (Cro superfamily)